MDVYPNPSGQFVTISSSGAMTDAVVKIVDLQGRTVVYRKGVNGSKCEIDLGQQACGTYFVEISNGGEITRVKLLKL